MQAPLISCIVSLPVFYFFLYRCIWVCGTFLLLCVRTSSGKCKLHYLAIRKVVIMIDVPTIVTCTGAVTLTQTQPAAPYVCRTGNIALRCQYGSVEGVSSVVWIIGFQTTTNPSTIPGHTALPRTTTYQEVVVDNYTNLAAGYRCTPTLTNGSQIRSKTYVPQKECECYQTAVS